jgi:DNA-binding transcriptional ArsR family regulator
MTVDAMTRIAGLLADRTRAQMCLALLDGRAWTAGELARHTAVSAPTATEHLHRLVAGGLLVEERQGRHRYVRLAGPDVAELVETLCSYATPEPADVRSLRAATVEAAMARCRTCYDHLAGKVGVALAEALTRHGLLDREHGLALTPEGVTWFGSTLGVELTNTTRRPLVRSCVDWTERRPHLAGVAGARLCTALQDRGWVVRMPGTRAVRITPAGRAGIPDLFGPELTSVVE